MTLPSSPSSIDDYGGPKENLDGLGVENPETDLDADDYNQMIADASAMTHTSLQAWVYFVPGASPTVSTHDAMWGNSTAPTVSHVSTGVYDVTWPATVTDALDASKSVNARAGFAHACGATLVFAQGKRTSANVVRVYVFNTTFAATDTGEAVFAAIV